MFNSNYLRRSIDFKNLIFSFCGPTSVRIEYEELKPEIYLYNGISESVASLYEQEVSAHLRQQFKTRLLIDEERCEFVASLLDKMYRSGRRVICVSDRLDSISKMYEKLSSDTQMESSILKGSTQDRDYAISKRVIIASLSIVSEGFDVPELDCLVIASPISSLEQVIGRVMRPHPKKQSPIVIDIVDKGTIFMRSFYQRMNYYKKKKYVVHEQGVNPKKESVEFLFS